VVVKRLPVAASAEQLQEQAEQVCDRFLAERAIPVTGDRRLDEQRWSTPELLALEQRLLTRATERRQTGCGQVPEPILTGVLARHESAGADQAAMVRDLCRDGVAVVVGRAGTGKTWALGLAREAFEHAGYQVLGCAPTGIATVSLGHEGFSDVGHQRRDVAGDGGQALTVGACHGRMPEGGHPLEVAAEVLEQAGRSKPAVHPPVDIGERIQVVQQGTVDAASILEVKQAIV
jgi:AAA domain